MAARWRGTDEPEETADASTHADTRGSVLEAFDPQDIERRMDILEVTGLPPEEFIVEVLESEGGKLPQQSFSEVTALSEASVSRMLQDLEADGHIRRVEIGREKIVFHPSAAPSNAVTSAEPSGDRPAP